MTSILFFLFYLSFALAFSVYMYNDKKKHSILSGIILFLSYGIVWGGLMAFTIETFTTKISGDQRIWFPWLN